MKKETFVEITEKIQKQITNMKKGVNGENVSWLNTREIRIVKAAPFSIFMKRSFNDDSFVDVDISKKTRGRPGFYFKHSELNELWPNEKPIAEEKLKDLKSIRHLIPQEFYSGVYADSTIQNEVFQSLRKILEDIIYYTDT